MSIITVAKSGNADYTSIKKAIENAQPGDKITVHPGLYKESLVIDKPLEISGGGATEETLIESDYAPCILMTTDSAKVSGFSLRKLVGEKDNQYPAVDISQGDLVLEDCDITSKCSDSISIDGSNTNPVIRRCRIFDSKKNGIWIKNNAKGIVEDCDIYNNTAPGILISNESNPIIRGCRIFDGKQKGISFEENSEGIIENCDIYNNTLTGILISNESNPIIRECRIFDGNRDGICFTENSEGIIENCDIYNHVSWGIKISKKSNPIIRECRIFDSKGYYGIWLTNSQCTIEDCDIYRNTYAGIYIVKSNPTIRKCRIFDGKTTGIWIRENSQCTIENCDIYNNNNPGIYIEHESNPTIRECRIFDGKSYGIWIKDNSEAIIEDCNIYQNKDVAVEIGSGSNPTIRRCRIYDGKKLGIWIKKTAQAHIEDCKLERVPCPGIKIDSKIQSTIRHTSLNTNKPFYLGLIAILVLPLAVGKGLLVSPIALTAISITMFLLVFYVFKKRGLDISSNFIIGAFIGYGISTIRSIGTATSTRDLVINLLFINSIFVFNSFKLSLQEYKLKRQYRITKSLK